jgi:2-amino-4-hydroxy-6-hydroxymethyldihydropteridine diphosphokinase
MSKLFIGLGSNKGNRQEYIDRAIGHLKNDEDIKLLKVSTVIETEPAGRTDQEKFLNLVVEIETFLDPYTLFKRLQNIERFLGRKEDHEKWGPREIDLDILLFDDLIIKGKSLKIPHPEMHKRDFVLRPLVEIAPDALHPALNKTAKELLEGLGKEDETDQVSAEDDPAYQETKSSE